MRELSRILTIFVLPLILSCCMSENSKGPLSVLIVSGGHSYDTAEFEQMFTEMPGVNPEFALKPDAWELIGEDPAYDVLVFYDMYQEISEKDKKKFVAEFEKGTGMVFMHHSSGSHQDWPAYAGFVGGKIYLKKYTADSTKILGYTHDISIRVNIMDKTHPVTEGMEDFEVIDEGYTNMELQPGLNYLLQTEHPQCDQYIGWEHKVKNSKVVYLMGGHDRKAYENESFSRIVENAIHWVAEKDHVSDSK